MALNVGELQATLGLKDKNFSSGLDAAAQQAQNLGAKVNDSMNIANNATDRMANTTNDLGQSFNTISDKASDATGNVNEFKQKLDDTSTAAKDAGKDIENTGDGVEKVGKKSKESSDNVNFLKSTLSALGIGFTTEKIVSALIDIGKKALQAAEDYEKALQKMQESTASSLDTGLYTEWVKELIKGGAGYSETDISSAMVSLGKAYPELKGNKEQMMDLTLYYLRYASIMGTDVTSAIEDTNTVMKKWGVSVEEQTAVLDYFYKTAGQNYISLSELVTIVGENDHAFQLMGASVQQAADITAAYANTSTISDLESVLSGVENLQIVLRDTLGSDSEASAAVQTLMTLIQKTSDEGEALNMLSGLLPDAGNKINGLAKAFEITAENIETARLRTADAENGVRDYGNTIDEMNQVFDNSVNNFIRPFGEEIENVKAGFVDLLNTLTASGVSLGNVLGVGAQMTVGMLPGGLLGAAVLGQNGTGISAGQSLQLVQNFYTPVADYYEVEQATIKGTQDAIKR